MKLKNVLLVVEDLERAVKFYAEVFELNVMRDFGSNVMMNGGLVLQERSSWEKAIGRLCVPRNHHAELYFEENRLEEFEEMLKKRGDIEFVTPLTQYEWDQKILRFYDPDGNLIEVGTEYGK